MRQHTDHLERSRSKQRKIKVFVGDSLRCSILPERSINVIIRILCVDSNMIVYVHECVCV